MGMFDEIKFAPEAIARFKAPLVVNETYQTKDLLDDDTWKEGVRVYYVRADGRLVRTETIGVRTGDGIDGPIVYQDEQTPIAYSGTITCGGEWDVRIPSSRLRYYDAEFADGKLVAIRDLHRSVNALESGVIDGTEIAERRLT